MPNTHQYQAASVNWTVLLQRLKGTSILSNQLRPIFPTFPTFPNPTSTMEIIQIFTTFLLLTVHVGLASSTLKYPDTEPIPAELDPEVARLVEIMNKPEPWDHL
jgi:hypothetical protein